MASLVQSYSNIDNSTILSIEEYRIPSAQTELATECSSTKIGKAMLEISPETRTVANKWARFSYNGLNVCTEYNEDGFFIEVRYRVPVAETFNYRTNGPKFQNAVLRKRVDLKGLKYQHIDGIVCSDTKEINFELPGHKNLSASIRVELDLKPLSEIDPDRTEVNSIAKIRIISDIELGFRDEA